jgi:hypothetical protein
LPEPPEGANFGDFKDELGGVEHITELAAPGSKNYAYRTSTGKTSLKVRGITLSPATAQLLNFASVKDMVLRRAFNERKTIPQGINIVRDTKRWTLRTVDREKVYRIVYTKRIVLDDLSTIPYGYCS